jgi:hypothetical protein
MIIDFTQRKKPEYQYFRNFNEIEIEKWNTKIFNLNKYIWLKP